MTWDDIAFVPDDEAYRRAAAGWRWLISDLERPFLCSKFGDLFLERPGGVWRLDTGSAQFTRLFPSRAAFDALLGGARDEAWQAAMDDWFLPPLIKALHAAGKQAGPGQCYGMTILPIFEDGAYTVENAFVTDAAEWLDYTGDMHRQLRNVPDGGQVRLRVE